MIQITYNPETYSFSISDSIKSGWNKIKYIAKTGGKRALIGGALGGTVGAIAGGLAGGVDGAIYGGAHGFKRGALVGSAIGTGRAIHDTIKSRNNNNKIQ